MTEYYCITGYWFWKTREHCPRRWWHRSSCPALLSCRHAFQRSLLSTEAQSKLYQVHGLGHKANQGCTWQVGRNVCLVVKILRYERYSEKVKKSSKAFNLAPTSAAARYHSLRVYFQLNEEKGEKESEFALIYPRLLTCSQFYSVPKLLEMFLCDCKTGCSSLKCTCPNGLVCMWQYCEGLSCSNIETREMYDVESDE